MVSVCVCVCASKNVALSVSAWTDDREVAESNRVMTLGNCLSAPLKLKYIVL